VISFITGSDNGDIVPGKGSEPARAIMPRFAIARRLKKGLLKLSISISLIFIFRLVCYRGYTV